MCDNSPASPRGRLVRALVEDCWRDQAGLQRMAELLTPGYVHHTPWGDGDYTQFLTGMEHVESLFTGRTYRVVHLVDDGHLVAAFLKWSATRQSDGSAVNGSGAYHCRLEGDRIAEDWDSFFPSA